MYKRLLLLIATGVTCGSESLGAQTILSLPGKRIEIVGLRRWTIPMIQDSLHKYAEGVGLDSHACAAALRYKLGFADASASSYGVLQGDSVEAIFIAVVEPADSARVRYRAAPMDTGAFKPEWARVARLVDRNMRALMFATQEASKKSRGQPPSPVPNGVNAAAAAEMADFLARHASPADEREARRVLMTDPNDRTRIVAAAILASFTSHDATLAAYIETLREADGRVKQVAGDVLFNFAQDAPRHVDWSGATDALHAILNGTSLFLLQTTLDLLIATRVNSSLAAPLLADGGEAVLDFLGARHPWPRESAHRLLVALSGRDFGYDVGQWRKWIEQLG
jgi:hypothetical protein